MSVFTKEQCQKGECLVECLGCGDQIHLDDSDDFELCEMCCLEEPFLSCFLHDDWADRVQEILDKKKKCDCGAEAGDLCQCSHDRYDRSS